MTSNGGVKLSVPSEYTKVELSQKTMKLGYVRNDGAELAKHTLRIRAKRGASDLALERQRAKDYKKNSAVYSRVDRGDDTVYAKDDVVSGDVKGILDNGTFTYARRHWGPECNSNKGGFDHPSKVIGGAKTLEQEGRVYHTSPSAKVATPRPDSPFKRAKAATPVVVVKARKVIHKP